MIPRAAIHEQEASYQRGLVLGLTMAEMAILIIFILLLALAALLAREIEKRRETEQQLTKVERQLDEAQQIAKSLQSVAGGEQIIAIIQGLQRQERALEQVRVTLREAGLDPSDPKALAEAIAVLQQQQPPAENWRELEEALGPSIPKPNPQEVAALAKEGAVSQEVVSEGFSGPQA